MVALHALATTLPRGVGARCGCLSGEGGTAVWHEQQDDLKAVGTRLPPR